MGLVVAPSRRLTAEEWAEVKTRSIQEGDSTQPCVMCREEFRLQPQFQEMNDSLVQSCSADVDALLNDIDRFVATRHDILCHFDNKYLSVSEMEDKEWLEAQEKAVQQGVQDLPICLNHLGSNNSSSKED